MVVVPVPAVVARPVPLITATFTSEDVQSAWFVIFRDVPSLKVAVATNCSAEPGGMCGH